MQVHVQDRGIDGGRIGGPQGFIIGRHGMDRAAQLIEKVLDQQQDMELVFHQQHAEAPQISDVQCGELPVWISIFTRPCPIIHNSRPRRAVPGFHGASWFRFWP